ncbi:alpha-amylase family glycosyl hydrolase [Kribbella sp. CA-294648]|uniref:alpha-amylase family glycosyl hydrolase n=1 Tax=Kribbella sp. CA-294648 TaxID=3239948 RepID=UPI003D93F852
MRELIDWLPHVASLGADGLLLGPVFGSVSHGYDTVSHRVIDDRLGTVADLDALVGAASAGGISVVLDGAFAYASRSFWRLTDPAEVGDPWFLRDRRGELVPWRVDSLVTPDYESSGYQDYVADVLSYWLDRGVAGWRLDSAWSVPADFWRRVLARVRKTHPTAWFLGQFFDDDLPPVVNRTTVSSTTEYALMHGIREWLSGGAADGMVTTLRLHRHNCYSRSTPHTFLGNHDFARLADTVPAPLLPAAFCLLLTLPGIPAIYYGDEFATTSTWAEGGPDSALRPAMSPGDLNQLGDGSQSLLTSVRALASFRRANTWLTSATLDDISWSAGALSYLVTGDGASIRVHINPTSGAVQLHPGDARTPAAGYNHNTPRPPTGQA